MSRLVQQNGDDYPEAAGKHLNDASHLLRGSRFDGASYLSGYVVECCLKTLIQVETGQAFRSHDLTGLERTLANLAALAGARTTSFYTTISATVRSGAISAWDPGMRYRAPTASQGQAQAWHAEAGQVYAGSVGSLILDGVI